MGTRLSAEEFQRALEFTPADLEANRAGRLSDAQSAALRAEVPGNRRATIGYGAVTLVLLLLTVALYVLSTRGWWPYVGLLAMVGVIATFGAWLGSSEKRHLGGGNVRHHSGVLEFSRWMQASGENQALRIDSSMYGLSAAQYDRVRVALAAAAGLPEAPTRANAAGNPVLDLDGHYRVYFLVVDDGAGNRVLSIEHRD